MIQINVTPYPNITDGFVMDHPLARISLAAIEGIVNGIKSERYLREVGIPSKGHMIPKTKNYVRS